MVFLNMCFLDLKNVKNLPNFFFEVLKDLKFNSIT